MDVSGGKKVFTPRDMGDFLGCVIDYDSKMVGGSDILAC
jgi:hypothetical protein